jgi:hypothetical protein
MHFLLWIAAHRNYFLGLLSLFLWVFANYWYLRRDIARWRRERIPHGWSADLATKTSKGGRGVKH